MGVPTQETLVTITRAVKLKVEGATWDVIAMRLGYASAESAEGVLQQDHPDEWRDAYEKARARYLNTVEEEAVLTQRELMRPVKQKYNSKGAIVKDAEGHPVFEERDEKLRQSAGHSLLNHTRQLRAQKIELTGGVKVTSIVLDAGEIDNGRLHDDGDGIPAGGTTIAPE